MSADLYYLLDSWKDEAIYLTGDVDGFQISPGGFTPATHGLEGGVDTFHLTFDGTPDAFDAIREKIGEWLELARVYHAAREERFFLVSQPADRTLTRRALIREGLATIPGWSRAAREAEEFYLDLDVDHGCPELDSSFQMANYCRNPSMEYENAADKGEALYWDCHSATYSLEEPEDAPHGLRVQQLLLDLSTDKLVSETIYLPATGMDIRLSIWVKIVSAVSGPDPEDFLNVFLRNAAGTATYIYLAVSYEDAYETWMHLWGNRDSCPVDEVRIDVSTQDAECTIQVDRAYVGPQLPEELEEEELWCDYHTIDNHDDWGWGGTDRGTEHSDDHQTFDIMGIPGDRPARLALLLDHSMDSPAASDLVIIAGASGEKITQAVHSLQLEDGDLYNGASLVTDADASGPATNNAVECPVTETAQKFVRIPFRNKKLIKALRGKPVRFWLEAKPNTGVGYVWYWGLTWESYAPLAYAALEPESVGWRKYPGLAGYWPPWGPVEIEEYYLTNGEFQIWLYVDDVIGTADLLLDRLLILPAEVDLFGGEDLASYYADYTEVHTIGDDGEHGMITTGDDLGSWSADTSGRWSDVMPPDLRLWLAVEADLGSNKDRVKVTPTLRPRYATL